jgi:hypothetical protein
MNMPVDFWQSKEFGASAVQAVAMFLQAAATLFAVWLAYRCTVRQMHRQMRLQVQQDLRHRQADALQVAWGLLQCLTVSENSRNFLGYEQDRPSGKAPPVRRYFMHLPNAQAFVFEHLPQAFYASGAGLHWSKEVKDRFFECRTLVYGFLLSEKQAHAPLPQAVANTRCPIQKTELAQRIETLYLELNDLLRMEVGLVYERNFLKTQ